MTTSLTTLEASLTRFMDKTADAVGWSADKEAAAKTFAGKSEAMAASIEGISQQRGVNSERILAAVSNGLDQSAPAGGLEPIAQQAAGRVYVNVYAAAKADLQAQGMGGEALERKANLVAAEVSGLHQSAQGKFLPIKYGCNEPTGIYGYLVENTTQIDGGSRTQEAFKPAPDAIASVLTAAQDACGGTRLPVGREALGGVPMTPKGDQSVSPTRLGGR